MNTSLIPVAIHDDLLRQRYMTASVTDAFISQLTCAESSRNLYRRTIRQFFTWVTYTGRNVATLTRADIVAYRDDMLKGKGTEDQHKHSPLTVSNYLTSVRLFYEWLESMAVYPNIAASIHVKKGEDRFQRSNLECDEVHQLVKACEDISVRDKAIIYLLLLTGIRVHELSNATIGDIDVKHGVTILKVQRKGHIAKDQFVKLGAECVTAINNYLQTRKDVRKTAPLFTATSRNAEYMIRKASEEGRTEDVAKLKSGQMTTRTISGIVKEQLKAIGLNSSEYTAHSLRHTYGCAMEENFGLTAAQYELGHKNQATTQRYTYHRRDAIRLSSGSERTIESIFLQN